MANRIRNCTICGGATAPARIDSVTGEEGALAVTLAGLPVLACDKGHRSFAHPDFPLLLLDHLTQLDEPTLPAGSEKGFIVKHFHCVDCGQELRGEPDHRHTFRFEVELPRIEPFVVELTTPVYRCAHCSREQLHSLKELRKLTPAALAHAFKAAQIPHG